MMEEIEEGRKGVEGYEKSVLHTVSKFEWCCVLKVSICSANGNALD